MHPIIIDSLEISLRITENLHDALAIERDDYRGSDLVKYFTGLENLISN